MELSPNSWQSQLPNTKGLAASHLEKHFIKIVQKSVNFSEEILAGSEETTEKDLQEFEELKRSFKKDIESLEGTNYDRLPLALLLLKVEEQEKSHIK